MASNCVDPAYLDLLVRNAIFKLLQDHTLQAGLKSCDCNWVGHETKVPTCDVMEAAIAAGDILSVAISAEGELVLTKGDGSTMTADLDDFVRDTVNGLFNELWPCGPLMQVAHDDTLAGAGTSCDPLRISPTWVASQDQFLQLVGYNSSTHVLTFQVGPTGGPYETFTVNLSTLLPIVATGPVLFGNGTLNTPLGFDCQAAAACIEPYLTGGGGGGGGGGDGSVSVAGPGLTGDGTSGNPLQLDCQAAAACIEPYLTGGGGDGGNECCATNDLVMATATAVASTQAPELPTTVFGSRAGVLGAPDGWMNIGGKRVPYWN